MIFKNFFMILLLEAIFLSCIQTQPAQDQNTEQILRNQLLSNYDKETRGKAKIWVVIKLKLQQIISIDERDQIMTSNFHLNQVWSDERLVWNSSDYKNISTVNAPMKKLWVPDTFIYNTADSDGLININDQSLASIVSNGRVYFASPTLSMRTRCKIDVRKFPFDTQRCSIIIGSWMYSLNRVGYNNITSFIDTSEFIKNSQWDLINYTVSTFFANGKNPYEYSLSNYLKFEFVLKRNPTYIMINGVLPCFLLNLVTLISYLIPYSAQKTLIKACFLTYLVNTVRISSDIPAQSDVIPLITIYFYSSIMFTLASMTWFAVCERFRNMKNMTKKFDEFASFLLKKFTKAHKDVEKLKEISIDSSKSQCESDELYEKKVEILNIFILAMVALTKFVTLMLLWHSISIQS